MDTLKANGIAPFALANKAKWPGSMVYMYLVDRIGGGEAFRKAASRAPGGSFADPAFVEAGRMLQEMVKSGAFAAGFNGLDYDVGGSRRPALCRQGGDDGDGHMGDQCREEREPRVREEDGLLLVPDHPRRQGLDRCDRDRRRQLLQRLQGVQAPTPQWIWSRRLSTTHRCRRAWQTTASCRSRGLNVTEPRQQRVLKMLADASNVQLWYDQELPPALGELHKDLVQSLLGLSITPEEAANKMEWPRPRKRCAESDRPSSPA